MLQEEVRYENIGIGIDRFLQQEPGRTAHTMGSGFADPVVEWIVLCTIFESSETRSNSHLMAYRLLY